MPKDEQFIHIPELKPSQTAEAPELETEEESNPSILSSQVFNHIANKSIDHSDFQAALKNPSTPHDSLRFAYNELAPKAPDEVEGEHIIGHDNWDEKNALKNLLANPNVPEDLYNEHVKRGYLADSDALKDHPKLSRELVHQLADKIVESKTGQFGMSDESALSHLDPDYYFKLLERRPIPEPENDTMTDQQKKTNLLASNIDEMAFRGLGQTKHHTPETIDRTVDLFTGEKPHGTDRSEFNNGFNRLIKHPLLNKQHLDKLYELSKIHNAQEGQGYELDTEDILKHPNADPALIAKDALNGLTEEGRGNKGSFENPKLPTATRKKIIKTILENPDPESDYHSGIHEIISNPTTDAEDLQAIYQAKPDLQDRVIQNPNATPDMMRDFYKNHSAKLDSMRGYLKSDNVPKDVLLEIVKSNKNQEIAKSALEHKNADVEVVEAGLKRKAAGVREAAMQHPLVAHKALMQGLKDKKISGFNFLQPSNVAALGGKVPEEAYKMIDENHDVKDEPKVNHPGSVDQESKQKFWAVKNALATRADVPQSIRDKNVKDIADQVLKTLPEDHAFYSIDPNKSDAEQAAHYIAHLAKQGNPVAQQTVLKRPGMMRQADLSNPGYGADFLKNAYEITKDPKEYDSDGGGWHPGTKLTNIHSQIHTELVNNPNTPEDIFQKIALTRDFLGVSDNIQSKNDRRYSNNPRTIFDERYGKLPEPQKRAAYQQLMDSPLVTAKEALLQSHDAPPDMWRNTFLSLDSGKKEQVLNKNGIDNADPETFKEVLYGKYNIGRRDNQLMALGNLDPKKPDHIEAFTNAALANDALSGTQGHIGRDQFAGNVSSEMAKDDAVMKQVTDKLFSQDYWSPLAVNLIAKQMSYKMYDKDYSKQFIAKMNDISNVPAGFEDRALSTRWAHLIQLANPNRTRNGLDLQNQLKKIVGKSDYSGHNKENEGALDFLIDLPDPGEHGLAQDAIDAGVISTPKIMDLMKTNPKLVYDGWNGLNNKQQRSVVQTLTNEKQWTPESMSKLGHLANMVTFVPMDVFASSFEDVAEATKQNLFNTLDQFDSTNAVDTLVASITNLPKSKNTIQISEAYKRKFVDGYIEHLAERPDFTPKMKYDFIDHLTNALNSNGEEKYLSPKIRAQIVDDAINSGNIAAIGVMLRRGNATPGMITKAVSLFEDPASMSIEDMMSLMPITDEDLTNKASRLVSNGLIQYAQNMPPANSKEQYNMYGSALKVISRASKSDSLTSKDATRYADDAMKFISGEYHLDDGLYQESMANAAAGVCFNLIQNDGAVPLDKRVQIWKNLPDKMVEIAHPDDYLSNLATDMLNDPAFIENSQEPGKLSVLMYKAENLTSANIDTVTNRAIHALESGAMTMKSDMAAYARHVIGNDNASVEQSNKIINSLPMSERYEVMDLYAGAKDSASFHQLQSQLLDDVGSILSLDQTKELGTGELIEPGSDVQLALAHKRLNDICSSVAKLADVTTNPETENAYKESLNKAYNHIDQFVDMAMAKYSDPDSVQHEAMDTMQPSLLLDSLFSRVTSDQSMPGEYLKRLLTMDAKLQNFNKIPKLEDKIHNNIPQLITRHIRSFEINDEDALSAVKQNPELIFAFSNRESLPAGLLLDTDWKSLQRKMMEGSASSNNTLTYEALSKVIRKTKVNTADEADTIIHKARNLSGQIKDYDPSTFAEQIGYFFKKNKSIINDGNIIHAMDSLQGRKSDQGEILRTALSNGIGTADLTYHAIKNASNLGLDNDDIENLADSAPQNAQTIEELLTATHKAHRSMPLSQGEQLNYSPNVLKKLTQNENLDKGAVSALTKIVLQDPEELKARGIDKYNLEKAQASLTESRLIENDDLKNLYEKTKGIYGDEFRPNQAFHPAFLNPTHGGDIFRSLPVKIPPSLADYPVNTTDFPRKTEVSKSRDRLRQAMQTIPPQGIDWKTWKHQNAALSNLPEVKQVFMNANNKPVTPEMMAQAIQDAPAKEFHLTYAYWDGAQRHRSDQKNSKNLVVQLNTSKSMEQEIAKDPKMLAFYQFVQKSANHTDDAQVSGHPVTPHIGGWVRVDVSGGAKGWIIEELQSDFGQRLHDEISKITENHSGSMRVGDYDITAEEMHDYTDKISKLLEGWHESGFQAIEEMAKKNGVENLFLHGMEPRAELSGWDTKRAYPIYAQDTYDKFPRKNGWQQTNYDDYPVTSPAFKARIKQRGNQNCWKKPLKP